MEADEIGVVLARAAELHAKISDAIERSMKLEFQSSAAGGKGNYGSIQSSADAAVPQGAVVGYGREYQTDLYDTGRAGGGAGGDGTAEARSLGAIRDALEVLEEQLESLQCLQQQQRNEKDAALVDLEESRRILLRRLKDHRGREWEIVHEALAFAGEPVPERPDDLPLPPYPRPVPSPYALDARSPQFHVGPIAVRGNGAVKKLDLADGDSAENDFSVVEDSREHSQEEGTASHQDVGKPRHGGGVSIPRQIVSVLAQFFGISAKAIGVVTVIAVIGYSEAQKRKSSRRRSKYIASRRPAATPAPPPPPPPPRVVAEEQCPPGKVRLYQNGVLKCVVKERFELPFQKEVRAPDVLFGRG